MIDLNIPLAFSIFSNKGVYALLLGSGVSQAAGIPTGQQIVEELIRRLARLQHEICEPNPVDWYKEKFMETPNYSKLLNKLAVWPDERNGLLREFFEPTESEKEQGIKMPTIAHKAIAELISKEYVRIIVTTNFDHLLEKSLTEVGVNPTVISTPDSVEGARPIVHGRCYIIKVNGDYLDTRFKNTDEELQHYDPKISQLMDRILDEFGLLVCGWSANSDPALREVLERCKNRRFSTYWTDIVDPCVAAKKLIQLRQAQLLSIPSADIFFKDLSENIHALEQSSESHPLSKQVAVARAKNYLTKDSYSIDLHDLIMQETENLYETLSIELFDNLSRDESLSWEVHKSRLPLYESITDKLLALIITGCYWGKATQKDLWINCLERIANPIINNEIKYGQFDVKLYPALILFYGGGLAAILHDNFDTFSSLLTKAKIRIDGDDLPLGFGLNTGIITDKRVFKGLPGADTPVSLSDHLYHLLRNPFRGIVPQDIRYERYFDRFEYLLALVFADLREKHGYKNYIGPLGRFWYRHRNFSTYEYGMKSIIKEIASETVIASQKWMPLRYGLFDGSIDRFRFVKAGFDNYAESIKHIGLVIARAATRSGHSSLQHKSVPFFSNWQKVNR
jgi:hypothetical protein